MLIGTKVHLREAVSLQRDGGNISRADNGFTYEEGVVMAELIGAVAYIECSEYDLESSKRASALLSWVAVVHRVRRDLPVLSMGLEGAPPKTNRFPLLKSRCIIS